MLSPHEVSILLQLAHAPHLVDSTNPDFRALVERGFAALAGLTGGAAAQRPCLTERGSMLLARFCGVPARVRGARRA